MACGYVDVEDWKKVLKADAELVHLRNSEAKEKQISSNLAQQVSLLQGQVASERSSLKILSERDDKLTKQLIDLDEKYQNERVKPQWGSPLAWTIAAVSTSVLAGVLIAGVVD